MCFLQNRYRAAIADKTLQPDPAQEAVLVALDAVIDAATKPATWLQSLFSKNDVPKGLYLYGPVGRGKTMLMDWALHALEGRGVKAERWHFHEFMLKFHHDLNAIKTSDTELDDNIGQLAKDWARRLTVLCFDEFHVTDVADAMIMMPLFTALFDRGVTVIATSNWAPDQLYTGGLQRARFLPFIDTVKQRMRVVNVAGDMDYRSQKQAAGQHWLYPLSAETRAAFDAQFTDLAGYDPIAPYDLVVGEGEGQRHWVIPRAFKGGAMLDLGVILRQALGAADFIALAAHFPLIFLDNLAVFTEDERDRVKRFMVLIDVLYDKGIKLVIRAETEVKNLYPIGGLLNFEFSRTISRLTEMTTNV